MTAPETVMRVVTGGLLTTIQDRGRPGWRHLGVPVGGACDRQSLAIANVLVGQPADAAALELTIVGPELEILRPCTVGLAGADLGGHVIETGAPLRPGRNHVLAAGQHVAFPGPASRGGGCRAYLSLAGAFEVPEVLGSRSTSIAGRFGGLDGRPLASGDVLHRAANPQIGRRAWPAEPSTFAPAPPRDQTPVVRIIPSDPAPPGLAGTFEALVNRPWTVGPDSDRMGLRLAGDVLDVTDVADRVSVGILPGAIQVPPSGEPIVLLADAQTIGGYPVVATATTVDQPILGQLAPGDRVRFVPIDASEAQAALRAQQAAFDASVAAIAEAAAPDDPDADWDELWRSAGG